MGAQKSHVRGHVTDRHPMLRFPQARSVLLPTAGRVRVAVPTQGLSAGGVTSGKGDLD